MKIRILIRLILFVIGGMLVIDGTVLFVLLKINFGTVVPFLIGVIFLIHARYWQAIHRRLSQSSQLKRIWQSLWALFGVWLMSFAVFTVALQRQIHASDSVPAVRAIIILGAGVTDGRPTKALANRLDRAAPIIHSQPLAVVITSGGIGLGKRVSEAVIMATYLHDRHNIPLRRIQTEENSASTAKNLALSREILATQQIPLDQPIAIVTNDFHTIRTKAIAEKQGYQQVIMVASETPWSIRFNAWFREYFAFVSGWLFAEY